MTIFKQYGELRTGTNYLKRLLETNFADITVFGSVLGWKHGLYQLNNGHGSPSAASHEDWVRQKKKGGAIYSVDNHPLPYPESFLLEASASLNYLVSWKPLLPWLVSLKRFRFPKKPYEQCNVEALFQRYIENYRTWIRLPQAVVVGHDVLLDDAMCICLLAHLQERYRLRPCGAAFAIEQNVVRASTDHGLLMSNTGFDRSYYSAHCYLEELPPWVLDLAKDPRYCTGFIEGAAWRPR